MYYGLNGLDKKLEKYLDYQDGYYVELGANDGVNQSNTLYYEKNKNWRGILIEPVHQNYMKCLHNRSKQNRVYHAACVSSSYTSDHVDLYYSNLMTTPINLESDIPDSKKHAENGARYLGRNEQVHVIQAPARTLSDILDDALAPELMDLLSLDVEGAELEVLKGLNHDDFRFKYLLIECRNIAELSNYLTTHDYSIVDQLSHHDYLFSTSV